MHVFTKRKMPEQIEDLRQVGHKHARTRDKQDLERKFNYSGNYLDNPHRTLERQRWIDRFEEIDNLNQPRVGEPEQSSQPVRAVSSGPAGAGRCA